MSETSANLSMPYLAAAQAQKHVTVNESLRKLDAIVQLAVVSATTTAQPGSPSDGQVYILPAGKTGAQWGAMTDLALAYYRDGAWEEIAPREGWLAWVKDTDVVQVYSGTAWSTAVLRAGLGLGSAALKATGQSGDAVPVCNGANVTFANEVISQSALRFNNGTFNAALGHDGTRPVLAANSAHDLGVFVGGATRWRFTQGGDLLPQTTESYDIGSASLEVDNIFLQNAATVSDARRKNVHGPIDGDQALAFLGALEPVWFSYKDTLIPAHAQRVAREEDVIEGEGEDARVVGRRTVYDTVEAPERVVSHRRPHAGFVAQQFKAAMEAAGIADFAGYAYDAESDTHLLRLMELVGVQSAAIKRLNERLATLEGVAERA